MTVTNPYYEFDPFFVPNTKARSDAVNIQYQAIQNAFDLLPGDSDALTTDTATFAPESGTGNVYVVTMPDTRTVNQDGDAIRFFATHTNTGPSTLDVDGIGPIALVNWTGTVLGGGEIVSGRIYEIRFDAVNTQFVISASTDGAIQVAFAEEWAITPEDVPVSVAAGGDGVTDFSSFHWAQKSLASATSGRVNTDIATATPPTTEGVTGAFEIFDADDDDLLSRLGFQGSNLLVLRNLMHGGDFQLSVETAAGVEVPYKFSDTRMAIPNAVGVTFDDSGAVERESLILESGSGGDADFAEVELLADGDGADGATTFTEQSLNAASATFVGNAQLDTAQFKFGTASFLMDGTGDYVTFPDDASLELGSDEFTIEGWVRLNTLPSDSIMSLVSHWEGGGSDRGYNVFLRHTTAFGFSLGFEWRDDFSGFESGSIDPVDPVTDQWFHFAVQRDANDALFMWWDGAREFNSSPNIFTGAIQDSTVTVKFGVRDPGAGGGNEQFLDGWLDDVRITIGAAADRYDTSGDITVPAAAFPTTGPSDAFKVGNAAIQTVILGSGGDAAQTIAAASGGLQANNALTGAGLERVLTVSDIAIPGRVLTDINTATPPTNENVTGEFSIFDADETDQLMRLGFTAGNTLQLTNFMHGGVVAIASEDAGGIPRPLLQGDPDTVTAIYAAGVYRFDAQSLGRVGIRSDASTDTEQRKLMFNHQNAAERGWVGYDSNGALDLRNEVHGGEIRLSAEDSGGVVRTRFVADPNSTTDITANTRLRLLIDNGNDAIVITGGAGVDLFDNDIERFSVTASGLVIVRSDGDTDAEARQIVFAHQDGTVRAAIGHFTDDTLIIRNEIHNGEIQLIQEDPSGVDVVVFSANAQSGQTEINAANVVRLKFNTGDQAFRAQVGSFAQIFHDGIEVLKTTTTALGGVSVTNLLTGSGLERVLTTGDLAGVSNLGQVATGSTTLTNTVFVGVLNAGPAINTQHMVNCSFEVQSPAADDIKVQFALNVTGDTFKGTIVNSNDGSVQVLEAVSGDTVTNTVVIPTDGTASPGGTYCSIQGVLKKGGNAGTFSLRVAKNADAGANGLFAFGSGLVLLQIP